MRRSKWSSEAGSASLEFLTVGVILLVPLVYLVLAMSAIQAGALAVEGAARQAARVAVQAIDSGAADVAVEASADPAHHRPLPPSTAVLVFAAKRDTVWVAVPSRGTLVARSSERNSGTSGSGTLAETVTRTRSWAARQSPVGVQETTTDAASASMP